MQNKKAAITRTLADPEFQGWIVHRSILAVLMVLVLLIADTGRDVYRWMNPQQPAIFVKVAANAAPVRADILSSPVESQSELLSWAVKSILQPYNVNYHDFPSQLDNAGKNFSYEGWKSFAQSYIDVGNFEKMKKARLTCYAQPTRSAVVKKQEIVDGMRIYTVQVPIVQTCENVNDNNSQSLLMTAFIKRVVDPDHPDGLVIDRLVARPNTSS